MPMVNVNIQPEIIHWALSQTSEEKLGDKLMNNISQWLSGTKTPDFQQIEDFSKKSQYSFGIFFPADSADRVFRFVRISNGRQCSIVQAKSKFN